MGNDNSEKTLKGYTENDTNQFYFIAGVNMAMLAFVIMMFSGGSGVVTTTGNVTAEGAGNAPWTWWSIGRDKWAQNVRPWDKTSTSSEEAAKQKAKVVKALQTMQGCTGDHCDGYSKEDVL